MDTELTGADVTSRAKSAVIGLVLRSIGIRVIGLVSYLVLARLLSPRDFGIASIGLSLSFFGGFLADAGLGAAFVRGKVTPDRDQLGALQGLQLTVVALLLIPVLVWLVLSGGDVVALVTAFYVASLFTLAVRAPAAVLLERRLVYRPVIVAEVSEALVFNVVAVTAVAVGGGVVALGVSTVVKGLVGAAILLKMAPEGRIRPNWAFGRLRPFIGFGVTSQAGAAAGIVRDQSINYGTAGIAGLSVLGIWTLASKVMLLPAVLFDALFRVAYPAFARMQDTGADLRPLIERATWVLALAMPVVLIPLVAGGPEFFPAILGDEWRDVNDLLPYACIGTALSIPVSVAGNGALFAEGAAGRVLRNSVGQTVAAVAVSLVLLPALGIVALGIGLLAAGVVAAAMTALALRDVFGARTVGHAAAPVALAIIATVFGRVLAVPLTGVVEVVAGVLVALAVYGLLARTVQPHGWAELTRLAAGVRPRGRPQTPQADAEVPNPVG